MHSRTRWEELERRILRTVTADFNGDGFADLAIGVHGENNLAGAVSVIYGTNTGLSAGGKFSQPDQFWTQNSVGIADASEAGDQFGRALAAGDFNHDGFADLAIGVPFEDGTTVDSGLVQVLYGSAVGLTAVASQQWFQSLLGRINEEGDRFGGGLAAGDFNNDGYADLAVGRPGETGIALDVIGAKETDDHPKAIGGADVIYGSPAGLTAQGTQPIFGRYTGTLHNDEQFGAALVAGDFNGDEFDDLALAAPGFPHVLQKNAGALQVFYGTFDGFIDPVSVGFSQSEDNIPQEAQEGDRFGFAVSSGDYNGDGASDLAIGVPFDDFAGLADLGAVHVLYGAVSGSLTAAGNQLWTQSMLSDQSEAGDFFGVSLASGDFNADGRDDLAIGASREDLPGAVDAGAVNVVLGSPAGLTASGNQFWNQDTADVQETAEASDQFGFALTADDFNGDGRADLAVGVIRENNVGASNVIYGSAAGLSAAANQLWSQDTLGIEDAGEANDFFGVAFPGVSGVGNAGFSGAWVGLTQTIKSGKARLAGSFSLVNPGTAPAAPSVVRFVLSDDATLSDDDQTLREVKVKRLSPEKPLTLKLKLKLAKGLNASGKFVIAVLDATGVVSELDETNNVVSIGPIA
jgi:hypothetical protein